MDKKNNKPQIRFIGFTDPWEQRKLGTLLSINSGKDYKHLNKGNIPVYGTGGLMLYVDEKLSSDDAIGIGRKGTIDKPQLLRAPFWTVDTLFFMVPKNSSCLLFFYALSTKINWKRFDESTGVPSLSKINIQKINLPTPRSREEQIQIGLFNDKIDNLITLHQRKLDKLEIMKKSLLEKMFPKAGNTIPEIRFKNFNEPWEQRKLGELGKATGGTSIESEFTDNGKYKVISIGSYSESNIYNDQGIRVAKTDKIQSRILNKNDLTMILNDKTASGNIIGRVLLIDTGNKYVYNQRTERIEVFQNKYDSNFLYHLLNADNVRKKIIKSSQGNTQIYVNWTAICKLKYLIPNSKFEQIKIGILYNNLDNLITLHQRQLEKLKNIKKSLLDKMFV